MRFNFISLRKQYFSIALCCFFPWGVAVAAEWSIEPSISLHEEYNDNIRFTPAPHPKVWQTTLRPSLKFSNKTEVSEVSGQLQLGINRYAGDPTLNQTDQLLLLFASRMSERNTWSMNTSYRRDTTSEVATTGLVQSRTQRSALTLNPSWTRSLTEKTSLRLDYQYQDVKYDKGTSTNYTYKQGGATLQYVLTERDKVSLGAFYSKVDYAPNTTVVPVCFSVIFGFCFSSGTITSETVSNSNTRGVQVDWNHLFSETMTGSFSLGRRNVINTSTLNQTRIGGGTTTILPESVTETHSNNYSLSGKLDKQFESGTIGGLISRDVNPSGSGLVQTTQYGLSMSKSLTEKLTASLDTSVYHTTYISVTAPGSRYYTFEPRLSWHFSEAWMLDSGYRFARVQYDNGSSPITANAVYLNLTYSWPKIAVSR